MNLIHAKALTIWQPYATLLVAGIKKYETRHWDTAYRGPVVITAGLHWSKQQAELVENLKRKYPELTDLLSDLPTGEALGVVELKTIHQTDVLYIKDNPLEMFVGNFNGDRYAWEMVNQQPFQKPMKVKGRQGLWNWSLALTEG